MRAIKEVQQSYKVSKKPTIKRGEKEAISLRRRRLFKTTVRAVSMMGVAIGVISSIYLWKSGKIENWIYHAETKVEDSLVEAGLTIENINIKGQKQTAITDIKNAVAIELGSPLLTLDIKAIKGRVEQLKWVKTATIARKLPDEIIVNITEHNPAALWQVDNKLWVLSDQGYKITDEQLTLFSQLPMISGAGADLELHRLLIAVKGNEDLFNRVETASWIGKRRWDLILKNGIKIMLPETGMKQAWINLINFEQHEKLLSRNILAVDFRIKDKTIVRLTPEEALRRRLLAKTSGVGEEI